VIERELKKPIKNGYELAEAMVRMNSIIKPASLDPLRTLFHKADGLDQQQKSPKNKGAKEKNGSEEEEEEEVEEKKETEDKGEKKKPQAQENGGEDGKGEKKAKASKAKEKRSNTEKEEEEKEEGKKSPKTGGKGIDWLSKEESNTFFSTILPGMQKIALKLPELFKDIPLLKQGHPGSYSIDRTQAACLVYTTRYTLPPPPPSLPHILL